MSAAGITTARLDAEALLSNIIKKDRVWLITHRDDVLDNNSFSIFEDAVRRRARREPLQYILGMWEFWGLEFSVTPDVLIPRPETELVVESAIGALPDKKTGHMIIDLCAGSGCIAVSLAVEFPAARVIAADLSAQALAIARQNARQHKVSERIRFFEGDLFSPLEELDIHGRIDIIASNPPYVAENDFLTLQPEVRDHEPKTALVAGTMGTEVHERIIRDASRFLKHGGALIMEMGIGQAAALKKMIQDAGMYAAPVVLKDLAGIDRVIVAKKI